MQLHYPRAGDEGRVHLEEGVLGRGPHEHEQPVLHGVEQRILLAAVEAVDLVHEQDGAQAAHEQSLLRRVDLAAQVGDGAPDGRDLHERGAGGLGDDMGERGLPRAGGAEEDNRTEAVVLDGGPKPAALAHGLALAHHLIEGARAHAHG